MNYETRKNLVFKNLTSDYGIADDVHDTPYAFDANRFDFKSPTARCDDMLTCYRVDEEGFVRFEEEIGMVREDLGPVPFQVTIS